LGLGGDGTMSDKVAPVATVVIDNPHADGYVAYRNRDRDNRWRTVVKDGAVLSNVSYDRVEFLDALGCLKPTGYVIPEDMTLWQKWVKAGQAMTWRLTSPAVVSPRRKFLDYFSSVPGCEGGAIGVTPMHPYFGLIVKRYGPNSNATGFDVGWAVKCTPFQSSGSPNYAKKNFCFFFPTKSQSYNQVYATMSDFGTDPMTGGATVATCHWEDIGEGATEPGVEMYWFEEIAGWWVIRKYGAKEPWVWRPPVADPEGAFARGNIELVVWGQCAMFWAGPIHYQDGAKATYVDGRLADDGLHSPNRVYASRVWTWPGKAQTVSITEQPNPWDAGQYVLEAKFNIATGSDDTCPALWTGVERAAAIHAPGVSSPVTCDNVKRLEYTINYKGRGQSCKVEVLTADGMETHKGNDKLTATVGWTGTGTQADDMVQKFLGYVAVKGGLQRVKDLDRYGPGVYVTMSAGDPIEARLAKKFWLERSSPAGKDLALLFYEVLWDAGQPDSMLTGIYYMIGSAPIVPDNNPVGQLAWEISADTCIIDALDQIATACGYGWGWDAPNGDWFLRPEPLTTLTPTVTVTDDSLIMNLKHDQGSDEFRNCIVAYSDYGVFVWWDGDSIGNTNAANFIGDDWWHVMLVADTPNPFPIVQQAWQKVLRQASVLTWKQKGVTGMGPGSVLKFQVTQQGITLNQLYRIEEEVGTMEQGGQWYQEFTAEKWVSFV
jgi:hypothetical protein